MPGAFLELECLLEAPREQVFRMLTDPVELATWWGPHGFTTPSIELDLSVGGRFRLSMQPPEGEVFHLSGEFLEIEPSSRLAYSFRWDEPTPDDRETVVTLSLQARGDTTQVNLSQGPFATEERVDLHRNGWSDSFEKLRRLIQERAQSEDTKP